MPTTQAPAVRRASAPPQRATDDQRFCVQQQPDEYDDEWPPRIPRSAVRYAPAALPAPKVRRHRSRSLYIILPIFCVVLGAYLAAIIPPAVQQWRDNNAYGFPRTFQTTASVGHGDPHSPGSHFIAMNLGGVLEVIEIPGGDPATYPPQLYRLATLAGPGADLVPVTVSLSDINGDGKPDLIASYAGTEVILFNNGRGFVPKL